MGKESNPKNSTTFLFGLGVITKTIVTNIKATKIIRSVIDTTEGVTIDVDEGIIDGTN